MTRAALVSRWSFVVLAVLAVGCGSKDDAKKEDSTTATIKFADIASIVEKSCGDANCHGKTTPLSVVYVDNETNFKNSKNAAIPTKTRMESTEAAIMMPKPPTTISAADKKKLLDFLAQ